VKTIITMFIFIAAVGCTRRSEPSLATAQASKPTPLSLPLSPAPSQQTTPRPTVRSEVLTIAKGSPFGLRVESGAVSFCDERGGRKLDTGAGGEVPFDRICRPDTEANVACGGLPLDVAVSTPNRGPNDVVDVDGNAYPLDGRVHDCAADGSVVAIVTGSMVVLLDTAKNTTHVVHRSGGDRVAIGREWVAWSDASTVHAKRR
jgi:hypothetical protein